MSINLTLNHQLFNPLGFHLLKWLQDKSIRHIILYGGSSSGKTYSIAQIVLILTMWEGTNHLVMRKVGASIRDTVYQDFKTAADQLRITPLFKFNDSNKIITCMENGARIVFKGCDDSEKIKGLSSFKRVVLDELSEYEEADYKQIRLRLRGAEGQQIIYAFNPIKETHWIKKTVIDKQKWHEIPMTVELAGRTLPEELTAVKSIRMNEPRVTMHKRTGEMIEYAPNTVVIQTTYLNNFWVVGSPDGTYGYYDEQCIATFEYDRDNDPDYYNVYALGEWGVIRTGSEFFGSFNRGKHTSKVAYNPELPVHLSIDSNVLPYISISYWQIHTEGKTSIRQIAETCAESPNNSARKAAKLVAKRLHQMGVDKVYLHGDASTRAANTIDDDKRSFLDLFISVLQQEGIEVIDCVGGKNPNVAMTGEFINSIFDNQFEDIEIVIDERCSVSIEDYMSVQKDVNGAILKTKIKNKTTGQTYEEHGHISDTFRYVVADVLKEDFITFSNRRKRNLYARDGAIHYYNPEASYTYTADVLYAMPNLNGKFGMVHGYLCGDRWHILHAELCETTSTEEIRQRICERKPATTIIECAPSYYPFVKELRKELEGVRVMKEQGDVDRRIAATSDYVKSNVFFNENMMGSEPGYSEFISNMLDYNRNGENKEASSVLSGFIRFVVKSFSNRLAS